MSRERSAADAGRPARLMLELLRPGGPRGFEGATVPELAAAARLAARHGLFPVADRSLRALCAARGRTVAAACDRELRPLRDGHLARALRHEDAECRALEALHAAGAPTVVLKGSALAAQVYGDAHCRSSADVDVLVGLEDLASADGALARAGYRRADATPLGFWVRRAHHAVYQSPGGGTRVELHWNFSVPGFFRLEPREIWSGVVRDGLHGRLDRSTTLVLLLMHHHLHGCASLRTLLDLLWAFEGRGADFDDGEFLGRIAGAGLLVASGVALRQARRLWGEVSWPLGTGAQRHRIRVRLLAALATPLLRPERQPHAADRFAHALVHRLGLDSPRRVAVAFAKTVVPAPADVGALAGTGPGLARAYLGYYRWRLARRAPRGPALRQAGR